ncbi:MAG: hypothetical protein FWE90_02405 [Defluviitaleaceae bacterium]|nr:hypothetical protein [Defluviitaleaceae bacterium]
MRNPADYDGKIISVLGDTAVLSDKRLFCTGPYIDIKKSKRAKAKDNTAYVMKDYVNSRIRQTKPMWLLIIGLLTVAFSALTAVSAFNAWVRFDTNVTQGFFYRFISVFSSVEYIASSAQWSVFFYTGVAAVVMLVIYKYLQRTWLEVYFTDTTLIYNVTAVNSLEVQEFQRYLRLVNKGKLV